MDYWALQLREVQLSRAGLPGYYQDIQSSCPAFWSVIVEDVIVIQRGWRRGQRCSTKPLCFLPDA